MIFILGGGHFAQEVYSEVYLQGTAKDFGEFGVYITFSEDEAMLTTKTEYKPFSYPLDAMFILGVGVKKWRLKFIKHFTLVYENPIKYFPNVFAESANISPLATMGIGNIFLWNTLVRANASIGDFNLLNAASIVHHDVVLGNNNVLLPQAQILGDSKMGNNNVLASSAVVVPKVTLGNDNSISAGEVLFEDIEDRKLVKLNFVLDKP